MKTSHFILLGAIGLFVLNSPDLLKSQQQQSAIKDARASTKATEYQIKEASRAALARYRGNCARVVDARSRLETQLIEGQAVVDPATGFPVQDKAFICTKHGDTAISQRGIVTDIKRFATGDLEQLTPILKTNETARTREGV
jgi:hypothetical protein